MRMCGQDLLPQGSPGAYLPQLHQSLVLGLGGLCTSPPSRDKRDHTERGCAPRPRADRQARLDPLALSASDHERMVNGRAAASGEKRMDSSEEIAWFGNILNFGDILKMDGPLVEIGSRSVFVNSPVGGWQ